MRLIMNTHKRMNTVFALVKSLLLMGLLLGMATTGYSEQSITYIYTDHLGSPIKAINPTTGETWTEDYQPYGTKRLNQDGDNSVGYTGHRHEKSLNVTYMQGRWYHPGMGRFLALDPVRFVEGNPASFNRYAYANNNPYKYVDPDGNSPLKVASLALDVVDLGVALATGNSADAVLTIATMLEPTGVGTLARRSLKAGKVLGKAGDVAKGAANGARAGKSHTRGAVKEAKRRNAEANGGDVLCTTCGVKTTPTTRRTKGSTVDPREGQGDHIYPRAKGGNGATVKDQTNIDIKCAACNNKKSDSL